MHDLLERECRRRGIKTEESELRSARLATDLASGSRTMRLSAGAREELLTLVVSLVASGCALLDVEAVILRGWIKLAGASFLGEMRRRLQLLLAEPPRILTLKPPSTMRRCCSGVHLLRRTGCTGHRVRSPAKPHELLRRTQPNRGTPLTLGSGPSFRIHIPLIT